MEGYDAELFASSPSDVETFHFDDLHIRLSCSKAATTDFDETGHIVWPASRVLSWYLKQTDLVRDQHVLEIGCGCGLVGIVSHSLEAASVTFTDRDPQISKILSRTFSLNQISMETISVHVLDWTSKEDVEKLLAHFESKKQWPTLILGADVFHTSFDSPSFLFATAKRFLLAAKEHSQRPCSFLACFALRQGTDEALIQSCAESEGFSFQKPCIRDMLPKGMKPDDFTKEKLRLIQYVLEI